MAEPRFDVDEVFDDDYLWFYEPFLAERPPTAESRRMLTVARRPA